MKSVGLLTSGRTVGIICRWYEACDNRGISAIQYAKRFQEMSECLLKTCKFDDFPPPGTHVNGIPLVTFEGILQSNTMRLCLYQLCDQGTYNNRAVSTLAAESFFSDLSAIKYTTTGCPKAVQIPSLLSNVTMMNRHKHNPGKYFLMELTNTSVYPTHQMDAGENDETNTALNNDRVYFKNHHFDQVIPRSSKRHMSKRFRLKKPDETQRGAQGIRQYYKVDQSKISDLDKM